MIDTPLIVGFGENSVDHVYRVPVLPQAAGASSKVQIDRHDVRCGGQVATTLATCAALGVRSRYVGAFGTDDNGTRIRQEVEGRGVDLSHAMLRDAPNRYAIILVDPAGDRVVLWEKDPRLTIAAADVRREWLASATLLHVDGTDVEAALALARIAREQNLPVTCDVDADTPATRELIATVTMPILAEHLPGAITGQATIERALRSLRQPHHTHLVATLGAHGAAMLAGDQFISAGGVAVDVVDTTGAGDVFRGAFIVGRQRGLDGGDLLRFANEIAAASCTKQGALGGAPGGTPQ